MRALPFSTCFSLDNYDSKASLASIEEYSCEDCGASCAQSGWAVEETMCLAVMNEGAGTAAVSYTLSCDRSGTEFAGPAPTREPTADPDATPGPTPASNPNATATPTPRPTPTPTPAPIALQGIDWWGDADGADGGVERSSSSSNGSSNGGGLFSDAWVIGLIIAGAVVFFGIVGFGYCYYTSWYAGKDLALRAVAGPDKGDFNSSVSLSYVSREAPTLRDVEER